MATPHLLNFNTPRPPSTNFEFLCETLAAEMAVLAMAREEATTVERERREEMK